MHKVDGVAIAHFVLAETIVSDNIIFESLRYAFPINRDVLKQNCVAVVPMMIHKITMECELCSLQWIITPDYLGESTGTARLITYISPQIPPVGAIAKVILNVVVSTRQSPCPDGALQYYQDCPQCRGACQADQGACCGLHRASEGRGMDCRALSED